MNAGFAPLRMDAMVSCLHILAVFTAWVWKHVNCGETDFFFFPVLSGKVSLLLTSVDQETGFIFPKLPWASHVLRTGTQSRVTQWCMEKPSLLIVLRLGYKYILGKKRTFFFRWSSWTSSSDFALPTYLYFQKVWDHWEYLKEIHVFYLTGMHSFV